MNKIQKISLSVVMLCVVIMISVFVSGYLSDRRVLSSLKQDLSASTAAWKKINEDKLVIQKDLKAAKNELREAELTISDAEERAAELEAEISSLEQEIQSLQNN